MAEAEVATFEATVRKAMTKVGEAESKRGFLTALFHSKSYMRLSSHTTRK